VLAEKWPLIAAAFVVALKEGDYRPVADPRTLLATLRDGFKRNATILIVATG
jgi:hypothetical protein